MGCKNSTKKKLSLDADHNRNPEQVPPSRPIKERPPFTEHQKELIRRSWKMIQDDISKVGVITFLRLFEKYPDVQDIFIPFKGQSAEELKNSDRLREHGLQVMRTVEKAIARLDQPEKLETMLHELGRKHVMFNTKVDYMDLIGPQFILAIKPTIKDSWTIETEEAWSDFFKFVTCLMTEAMIF
ncbi:non-symbiotic hemoglobin-like [Argonauta hians]